MIPAFEKYAGPSSLKLTIGSLTIWFSYKTPVAFQVYGQELKICQNRWAQTTGKHLNAIDPDKTKRIPFGDLIAELERHLEGIDCALEGLRA